jgi:peptidyl-tRNA hydrolase
MRKGKQTGSKKNSRANVSSRKLLADKKPDVRGPFDFNISDAEREILNRKIEQANASIENFGSIYARLVNAGLGIQPRSTSKPPRKTSRRLKVVTIKKGDKLFLVTRRDLEPGYQAVQTCHAIRQFSADHKEVDCEWFNNSNYLAMLSVENEIELMRLIVSANDKGLKHSVFREPDFDGAITAIALEPHPHTAAMCSSLPLALKEFT